MSLDGPVLMAVPQTAICWFTLTFTHAGSLGLSWTTYGYLSRRFLAPLLPKDPEEEAENVKQLVLKEDCKCSRCKRGQQCIFDPVEAPWTYVYRTRHDWFPRAIQLVCTAGHIFVVSESQRSRRFSAEIDHMYVLAVLGGGLAGLAVAKRATLRLNSDGPEVVLEILLRKYLPTMARALDANFRVAGRKLSDCQCMHTKCRTCHDPELQAQPQLPPTILSNATTATKRPSSGRKCPTKTQKQPQRVEEQQRIEERHAVREPTDDARELTCPNTKDRQEVDEPKRLDRLENKKDNVRQGKSKIEEPAVPVIGSTSRARENSPVGDDWIEAGR